MHKRIFFKKLTALALALTFALAYFTAGSQTLPTARAEGVAESSTLRDAETGEPSQAIPLRVTSQPESVSVKVWTAASFSVAAEGTGSLRYQWYYRKPDSNGWILWDGHDAATASGVANPTWNLMRVRCEITDEAGASVTSEEALVTVVQPLVITAQPTGGAYRIGMLAQFSVSAKGTGALRYQWYYKKTGSDGFLVWNGQKTAVITATANDSWDGMRIRCEISDEAGARVTSEEAVIRLAYPPTILTQPQNVTLKVGDSAQFSVSAEGTGELRYQWYYKKTDSDRFYVWNGKNAAVITATANATWDGMQVRCRVSDAFGNATDSEAALVRVELPLAITVQPADVTAAVGKAAVFTVKAQGAGTLQYQWYSRLSGAATWSPMEGKTSASLTIQAEKKLSGMEVYCLVKDASGSRLQSSTAKLTVVSALKITSQPAYITVHSGETGSFTVKAEGSGLKYQWYYKKAGKGWTLWKNRTGTTASAKADCTWHGMQVYCRVTDETGEHVDSAVAYSMITKKSSKRYIKRTVTVKSNGTKLYSNAGTSYKVMGKVAAGKKFTVLEWKNDAKDLTWFRFKWKGKNVWVPRTKVKITDAFTSIPDRSFKKGGIPVIYLSPSRQIHNEYKVGSTTEGAQMYRVGNELKKIMEKEYVCLVYMPPQEMKITIESRPTDAYNKETDIYLAIHSNANPSGSSYGAVGYYFPACKQSERFAGNMADEMRKISPFTPTSKNKTANGMKLLDNLGYGEVRDPAYFGMVSLLAEVEYHDNADSARWIINHPKKIARALANSLEKTFDLQKK